jgi:uncharacterized protein DUF3606
MADDKTKRGQPDRDRIDINDDDELRSWSKSMNETPDEIKGAVRVVGNSAAEVDSTTKYYRYAPYRTATAPRSHGFAEN